MSSQRCNATSPKFDLCKQQQRLHQILETLRALTASPTIHSLRQWIANMGRTFSTAMRQAIVKYILLSEEYALL
eukprot:07402.XXX_257610_257831_1 [CDS] Oithona nana genome sequencing.